MYIYIYTIRRKGKRDPSMPPITSKPTHKPRLNKSRNHAGAPRDSRSWIAIHSYVGPDVGSHENGIATNVALN